LRAVAKPRQTPTAPSTPPWVSINWDASAWVHVLDSIGCDETSKKDFFLLSQVTDLGPDYANNIISDFLKKQQDGSMGSIFNPSAFLHKSVLKSRQEISSIKGFDSWRYE